MIALRVTTGTPLREVTRPGCQSTTGRCGVPVGNHTVLPVVLTMHRPLRHMVRVTRSARPKQQRAIVQIDIIRLIDLIVPAAFVTLGQVAMAGEVCGAVQPATPIMAGIVFPGMTEHGIENRLRVVESSPTKSGGRSLAQIAGYAVLVATIGPPRNGGFSGRAGYRIQYIMAQPIMGLVVAAAFPEVWAWCDQFPRPARSSFLTSTVEVEAPGRVVYTRQGGGRFDGR